MFSVSLISLWGCRLSSEFTLTLWGMLSESAQILWNYYCRFSWVLTDFSGFCLETICWYVSLGCCPKHSPFIWRYFFNLFSSALLSIVYSAFNYIYRWMKLYSTLALDSLPACSTFPRPFFYLFLFQTFFPDLDTFVSSPDKAVK